MKKLMTTLAMVVVAMVAVTAATYAQPEINFGRVSIAGVPASLRTVGCGTDVNMRIADADGMLVGPPRYGYTVNVNVRNTGTINTAVFVNQILIDGAPAPVTPASIMVPAGAMVPIKAKIYASPGIHTITIILDNGAAVAETNEGNNRCDFTLSVVP